MRARIQIKSLGAHLFVQSVQAQRFIPVLLQLLHQLPALLHPLFRQLRAAELFKIYTVLIFELYLRALLFFGLVLLQLVLHVEQAAAELAEDILWQGGKSELKKGGTVTMLSRHKWT
jgi:hypothetical protein